MSGAGRLRAARGAVRLVIALAVVAGLGAIASARPVAAAGWPDSEYATTVVSTTSVLAPTKTGCANNLGLSVTYRWSSPAGGATRTDYVFGVYYQGVLQGSPTTPTAAATSVSTTGLLTSLLGGVTYTVRLQAASGAWRSAAVTGTFTTSVLGVITGCTW